MISPENRNLKLAITVNRSNMNCISMNLQIIILPFLRLKLGFLHIT